MFIFLTFDFCSLMVTASKCKSLLFIWTIVVYASFNYLFSIHCVGVIQTFQMFIHSTVQTNQAPNLIFILVLTIMIPFSPNSYDLNWVYFHQYACGNPTINAEDFATILLKHTAYNLDTVFARLPPEKDKVT